MVVAVVSVRMVKVTVDNIVNVISMRDSLMTAPGTMHMARLVPTAIVIRRADRRVCRVHL